jgi:hypothetical protein
MAKMMAMLPRSSRAKRPNEVAAEREIEVTGIPLQELLEPEPLNFPLSDPRKCRRTAFFIEPR